MEECIVGWEFDLGFDMAAIVDPGYSGGKGSDSRCEELRLDIVDNESRFCNGGPGCGISGEVRSFANS